MVDVLFVCVHNAGRSRMAEVLFDQRSREHHGGRWTAASAGTQPAEHPHPEVIRVMAEIGLTVEQRPGMLLTPELADDARLMISMGCSVEEACPAAATPMEDWALPDPKGKNPDAVRAIRDDIARRVDELLSRLAAGA